MIVWQYQRNCVLILCAVISFCFSILASASQRFEAAQGVTVQVPGWPSYLAMGAIGGPNVSPNHGDDNFSGSPVDAVFKYAGNNGNGDPGVIDPPMNVIRMTQDLTSVSAVNHHATRVVMVEYTGQMSGGENFSDFTNNSSPDPNHQNATYIMARHFASLIADSEALQEDPVRYNGQNYYGALILNPDLIGAMEQNNYINQVNQQLGSGDVNLAVDQALTLMTQTYTYVDKDKSTNQPWSKHNPYMVTFSGTPYCILTQLLAQGYPAWLVSSVNDQFWGININNSGSAMGRWFEQAVKHPHAYSALYNHPNFPPGFDGWVQANNWIIRTFAPKDQGVTFGWQENMWAVNSGWWLHNYLNPMQVKQEFSLPVTTWIEHNAPSIVVNSSINKPYSPDFIVFDRYEMDDSAAPGQATLYNANSWDNLLTAVSQVSVALNNAPVMLWQIPGSHLPYQGEQQSEMRPNSTTAYVFSSAPVYFFGDHHLKSDLSNLIFNPNGSTINEQVGAFNMPVGYHDAGSRYQQYLLDYHGKNNNFDWSQDNGRLALAVKDHVFAILWGGGNTTNVIKNFSNVSDHGWLAAKIRQYYQHPVGLINTH